MQHEDNDDKPVDLCFSEVKRASINSSAADND